MGEESKVALAQIYLDGKADQWYQGFQEEVGIIGWDRFVKEILARYDGVDQDPYEEFKKLKQVNSVSEYQDEFDRLKSILVARNGHYSEEFSVSNFVSGLRHEIKYMVKLLKPTTLADTISLAKMQESSLVLFPEQNPTQPLHPTQNLHYQMQPSTSSNTAPLLPKPHVQPKSYYHNPVQTHSSRTPTTYSTNTRNFRNPTYTSSSSNTKPNSYIIKRLTPAEMQKRREMGLCYNCDEKYVPGHLCKKQQIYMLKVGDEIEDENIEAEILEEEELDYSEEIPSGMEISMRALNGAVNHTTLRVKGMVKKKPLTILIDSGSTHSFLDTRATGFLAVS